MPASAFSVAIVGFVTIWGLSGCGVEDREDRLLELRRQPYLGVACARPNSIACDRVGLAVWLKKPAKRLTASIGKRRVKMRSPGEFVSGTGTGWEGFLQPAGLRRAPFNIMPDAGPNRWISRKPFYVPVRIIADDGTGRLLNRTLHVNLSPGWG